MNKKSIVLYGAGRMGKAYLHFLRVHGLESIVSCFCDRDAKKIGSIDGKEVFTYEEIKNKEDVYVLSMRKEYRKDVIDVLMTDGKQCFETLDKIIVEQLHLMPRIEYERELCAISHIDTMDYYFDVVEYNENYDFFWNSSGVCKRLFSQLDLENVVELACGRGRHVPQYLAIAGHVTLVDILDKNIEFCKKRFADSDKISYIKNNGYELTGMESGKYSALFTYDSMVHFEMEDIMCYIKETYRILKSGGKALFHHSNNTSDYKASYDNAVEARSFMSAELFAYLAYRAGFDIEEQRIVDWGVPKLDCLSLVVKR